MRVGTHDRAEGCARQGGERPLRPPRVFRPVGRQSLIWGGGWGRALQPAGGNVVISADGSREATLSSFWGWNLPILPAAVPPPSRCSGSAATAQRSQAARAWGLRRLSPFSRPFPQFHAPSAGRGRPRSCDAQGILRRQNSSLGLALGREEADPGPLPLLPPAILRGGWEPRRLVPQG